MVRWAALLFFQNSLFQLDNWSMHGEILKMYVLSKELSFSNRAISNCMNLCHVTMYITKPQFTSQSSDLITIELDIHLFESVKYLPTANWCGVYRRTTALNTVLSVVVMNIPFDRSSVPLCFAWQVKRETGKNLRWKEVKSSCVSFCVG